MPKQINALELRKHFGEITDEVHAQKETYIVTKNGRPIMAMVEIETYQKLLQGKPSESPAGKEDEFIETYSKEQIENFLKEDSV